MPLRVSTETGDFTYDVDRFLKTQVDVLQSRGLALRVAQKLNLIGNPLKIKRVSSLFRQECVDDDHLHTQFNEAVGKIAADKPHATGNQHGTTVVLGVKVVQF